MPLIEELIGQGWLKTKRVIEAFEKMTEKYTIPPGQKPENLDYQIKEEMAKR